MATAIRGSHCQALAMGRSFVWTSIYLVPMCHGHFPFFPIILRWLEKLAPARSDFFTTISCDNSSPMAHGWHITHSQGSRPPSCTRRRQSRPLFWKCWLVLQQRCPLQQPSDHDASRRHPGEGYDTYNVLLKTSLCVCVFFCRGCGRHLSPAVKIKEWNGKI